MTERQLFLDSFRDLGESEVMRLPLLLLTPSQPDDGEINLSTHPIEVILDRGTFLILHGNHRYWTQRKASMDDPRAEMLVRRVRNFFIDY